MNKPVAILIGNELQKIWDATPEPDELIGEVQVTEREQRARTLLKEKSALFQNSDDIDYVAAYMAQFAESEVKRAMREVVKGLREEADQLQSDTLQCLELRAEEISVNVRICKLLHADAQKIESKYQQS